MPLGPVEVIVVGFPGSKFTGAIVPELERLVENDVINVIDGLLVQRDDAGELGFVELEEIGLEDDAAALAKLLDQVESLISDEDVETLAAGIEPGSSAAILVFEHKWAGPFRDAVVGSGGEMIANFRVPALVIDDLLAELADVTD